MVGVVRAAFGHLRAADVRAVVARARHHVHLGAVGLDHRDLLGARVFGYVDLACDPGAGRVGRDGVARVAQGVLHAGPDADRQHVAHERRRAAVLEGERGHGVVHLEQDAVSAVHLDHGRHAFAHRDGAPDVAVHGHEVAVAEDAPFGAVDAGGIPRGWREVELEEAAAAALGFMGVGGACGAAGGADVAGGHVAVSQKKRCGSVLVELGHGLDLDEAAEVQLGHGGDEAAGLVRAEEFGVDLVDRAPVLALRGEDTAVDDLVAAHAGLLEHAVDVAERKARMGADVAPADLARVGIDRELARDVEHALRDDARRVVALVFTLERGLDEFHQSLLVWSVNAERPGPQVTRFGARNRWRSALAADFVEVGVDGHLRDAELFGDAVDGALHEEDAALVHEADELDPLFSRHRARGNVARDVVDEVRHDLHHGAVRVDGTDVLVFLVGQERKYALVDPGEHLSEHVDLAGDARRVDVDAERTRNVPVLVTDDRGGAADEAPLVAEVEVRVDVARFARRMDRLRDQMTEAFAHLAARHLVVGDVDDRMLRIRQVVKNDFNVFAEGLGNKVGNRNVRGEYGLHK